MPSAYIMKRASVLAAAHTHKYIYIYTHTYIHTYMHTCIHAHVQRYIAHHNRITNSRQYHIMAYTTFRLQNKYKAMARKCHADVIVPEEKSSRKAILQQNHAVTLLQPSIEIPSHLDSYFCSINKQYHSLVRTVSTFAA